MVNIINNFPKQFDYKPEIVNKENLKKLSHFIVVGMGGSHLAAGILKIFKPSLDIIIHRNYGLPNMPEEFLRNSLIILNSYSGNTEEVINSFYEAKEKGLELIAVSTDGELLNLAKKNNIPYVQMPNIGIQPRFALGFNFMALLRIVGLEDDLKKTNLLSVHLDPEKHKHYGKEIAEKLKGFIPVIYASEKNGYLAYIWKIKFNETSQIPAFCNVFPELNHNEIAGFNNSVFNGNLSKRFYFIFLKDKNDNSKILNRMNKLEELYKSQELPVEVVEIEGKDVLDKIFSLLILSDWVTYFTAKNYNIDFKKPSIIEEFKKLIKNQDS